MLRNRSVQLTFTQISSTGRWDATNNRIEVSARFQSSPPDALAAVLAHEATHAQDHFRGLRFTGADCADRAVHAFSNQAQFWRGLHGPEGKRGTLSELDAQNNYILRLITDRPSQALTPMSEAYGEVCVSPTAVSPNSPPSSLVRLDIRSNDLVYDAFRRRIYASIPGAVGASGNSVAVIDPGTNSITHTIYVGSEPGQMALSHDGHFLYVGLNGAGAIRRVDLTSGPADMHGVAELQFPLLQPGMNTEDIAVQPGSPGTVAVSLVRPNLSPRHGGVAVFDDGVPRETKTGDHTGANRIEFGSAPDELYGYCNETTSFGFYRLSVTESGITGRDISGGLVSGFYHEIVFDNGLIYASTGAVIDPVSRTVVGTFPGVLPPVHRAVYGVPYPNDVAMVRPDSTIGRTFFLVGNLSDRQASSVRTSPSQPAPPLQPVSMQVLVFDQHTFTLIGAIDVPGILGRATSLIRWGSDGLAFRTGGGQTVLLRSPLVAGAKLSHPPGT
jgi:YVTN family beta-propeller protein